MGCQRLRILFPKTVVLSYNLMSTALKANEDVPKMEVAT